MNRFPAGKGVAPAFDDGDPIPPDDRVTDSLLREKLEGLYRDNARRLAGGLNKRGARDGLDLVHDSFARVLGLGRSKLASIIRPGAYVAQVARNLHNDQGRSEKIREDWLEELAQRPQGHHDQIVYLETRDALRRLEAALLTLKPRTREVFLARRVDGLSYIEIAALTGLSHKAIEKHMAKAIAELSLSVKRA